MICADGALQLEMTAALRARGLLAYPLRPHLADLLREVQAGNPVLVLQNLGLDWYPRWHYAVVFGYDLDRQIVRLRSGELADRRTGLRAFEQTWARAGHWAIVASTPQSRLAALAATGRWIARHWRERALAEGHAHGHPALAGPAAGSDDCRRRGPGRRRYPARGEPAAANG